MGSWKIINRRISECRRLGDPQKITNCLLDLLRQTNDGWVAFNLAQEYEKTGRLEEALEYYQKAERLLPLTEYKEKARSSINRVSAVLLGRRIVETRDGEAVRCLDDILKFEPEKTLLIISCTQEKVWECDPTAPDFVPARYAYRGKKFLKFLSWAERNKIEKKGFYWVILSGKYGFIEPWHPISKYDIKLGEPDYHPISDETLKNQVKQERCWRNNKIKMEEFKNIISINCSEVYRNKIRESFPEAEYYDIDVETLHQSR